ncbi:MULTISPECIES: pilus assembly protein TadG-related protein [unclassified Phycicoccus]|uniref:pilus assembly protein TadG-related protein n=1 Tax=unclassified Phycicoccus TaxID=2637926 RepID=UPI0007023D0D|nr:MULTISPECIES: pilus assembly protein TadG-related protein [unclassified Phycicoccus]KRF24174.1 hypothetical protein ASG95_06135 [Phycicoccus sp. Soil803]KRF27166.1 hypothetical protein ASG91_11730 [Phycicoccus sp. Soil802]
MSRLRSRRRDERGAVAVTVAMLMVVLVGIGAFTVDFGVSYVSTRQLQTASDSAALAAATKYGQLPGSCAVLAADTAAKAAVQSGVTSYREENRAGSTGSITSVACSPDGKALDITYSSAGSTESFLGGVFGHSSGYNSTKSATARVQVPTQGIGVRPYALCGSILPSVTTFPSPVFQMDLPSTGNSLCPGAASSGNWWSIDCPEAPSNSNTYLGEATLNGCTDPISIVPNQGTRTGSDLRNYLNNSCPVKSSSCLGANTGNLGGTPILNAWSSLVQERKRILLPVFCGTPSPCDQAAVVNAGGNNAIYPVQALVGVIVCGYHFGTNNNQNSAAIPMDGDCGGLNNPNGLTAAPGGNQDNYLLLRAVRIQVSGSSGDPQCAMGDTCDLGARIYKLVK